MKLNELIEQYGEYEVKNGFMELLEEPWNIEDLLKLDVKKDG